MAGLITPWNFPLAIPIWKAAPALAFGNAVLLKPAPEATGCALRLAELAAASLPDGLFQVAARRRRHRARAGRRAPTWSPSPARPPSAVRWLRAATARGIPVQAEMGGQNPAIVLPDADIARTATQIAAAALVSPGRSAPPPSG